MLKITVEEIIRIIYEIKNVESKIAIKGEEISEEVRRCRQCGFDVHAKCLEKVIESLFERRRNLYELVLSLERIKRIYQNAENKLLESLEECQSRKTREFDCITIDFSEELMELISHIKV